jgi:hypothetical protein
VLHARRDTKTNFLPFSLTRRCVDEPTLERLTKLSLDDHDATFGNSDRDTLTGQSTASGINSVSETRRVQALATTTRPQTVAQTLYCEINTSPGNISQTA